MNRIGRKLAQSVAVVGVAASIATLGTYASFTSTTSAAGQQVDSGTVTIGLGTPGTSANRLTVGATGVVPGDTIQRAVTVTNAGTGGFGSVVMTTTASTSSLLDTDGTNGLQMTVDRCSVAWTEVPVGLGYTYTCLGTTTNTVASRAVIGTNVDLGASGSLTGGGSDYYRITLTLPTAADNTFQGKTSVLSYAFTATQRAATDK